MSAALRTGRFPSARQTAYTNPEVKFKEKRHSFEVNEYNVPINQIMTRHILCFSPVIY